MGCHFGPRRSCSWSLVVSVDVAVADIVDFAVAVGDVGVADEFLVVVDEIDAVVGVGVAVVAVGVVVVVVAVVVAVAFADDASVADDVLCRLLFPEDDVSVAWR